MGGVIASCRIIHGNHHLHREEPKKIFGHLFVLCKVKGQKSVIVGGSAILANHFSSHTHTTPQHLSWRPIFAGTAA